ncbi:MAG: hypothetical protein U0401_01070 [Anaerolineae bacterium]
MISEKAAFTYALLSTPTALYPRSIFQRYFPLTEVAYGPDTLQRLSGTLAQIQEREQQAQGQEKAFLQLLIQGVESALAFLPTANLAAFDVMGTIEAYYDVVKEYYPGRLIHFMAAPAHMPDQYPEPAQDANCSASMFLVTTPCYPEGAPIFCAAI